MKRQLVATPKGHAEGSFVLQLHNRIVRFQHTLFHYPNHAKVLHGAVRQYNSYRAQLLERPELADFKEELNAIVPLARGERWLDWGTSNIGQLIQFTDILITYLSGVLLSLGYCEYKDIESEIPS